MVEQYNRNIVIIKVVDLVKSIAAKNLDRVIKAILMNPASIHVMDFSEVNQLHEEYKIKFLAYGQVLRKHKKHFFSINMTEQLKENIKRKETIDFFDPKNSLLDVPGVPARKYEQNDISKEKTTPNFVLSANYLQAFTTKAKYVLETQLKIPVQMLKPYVKGLHFERFNVEVTSLIEIKSKYLKGWMAFTFTKPTYLKVCKAMTGEDINILTLESLDTVSELLNMTYGCIKQDLNKTDTIVEMSLPMRVLPNEMEPYHLNMEKSVVVPFQTKHGFIGFEIFMDRI